MTELMFTKYVNDSSLVSYWPLITNSLDFKGVNNGTDTNITYGGSGASFNGVSSSIRCPNTGLNLIKFTISCWVYLAANQVSREFWVNYDSNHGIGFGIDDGVNNKVKFWVEGVNLTSNAAPSISAWHHIVATYDGSYKRIYIDGSEDINQAHTTNPTFPGSYTYIGSLVAGSQFFNGSIKDMIVFSRALGEAEILEIYNSSAPNFLKQYRRTRNPGSLTGQ